MQLEALKQFLLLIFGKLQDLEEEMLATECVLLEGGERLEGGTGWIAEVEALRETPTIKEGIRKRYAPFVSRIEAAATEEELERIVKSWKPLGRVVQ